MNKIPMSKAMVSPNVVPKEKQGLGVLARQEASHQANFDALVAREEEFIAPGNITGSTLIFSRAKPAELRAADAEQRLGSGTLAKKHIERKVNQLKLSQDKKEELLNLLRLKIKANHKNSSDTHLGIEAVRKLGQYSKIDKLPVAKQVRFVNAANSTIPVQLPKTVELPTLPDDD